MEKKVVKTVRTDEDYSSEAVESEEQEEVTKYAVFYQLIYLISGVIQALLGLRFLFKLTGASRAAVFTQFLYGFTNIFMVPFKLIFQTDVAGSAVFEWSVLVAMVIYSLATWLFVKILKIMFTADVGS